MTLQSPPQCGCEPPATEWWGMWECPHGGTWFQMFTRRHAVTARKMESREYCQRFYEGVRHITARYPDHKAAFDTVRLDIEKSCLLSRLIHGGEQPSQTPCPVHKGVWSGIDRGWPGGVQRALVDHDGHKAGDTWPAEVLPERQADYDAGCRCFQHSCGCTTGWNPDSACGCVPAEVSDGHL